MFIDRLYPLKTSVYEDMDQVNRCTSGSLSESDDYRKSVSVMNDNKPDVERKRKHRRGRKRNRPKWKPYAKMSEEERKSWDTYEQARLAQKEKKLAVMSRRPVAPFNTTQFLMDDRTDSQVYKPRPQEINRCVSFDSSSCSGEESFELDDDSFHEQDAFLEADFNQVYNQLRMDRLETMNKQDLVQQCFTLEDRIATYEQEKVDLLKEVQELREVNRRLIEDNSKLTSDTTNSQPITSTS